MKPAVLLTVLLLSGCATLDDYVHSAKQFVAGFDCDIQGYKFDACGAADNNIKPASYKP